MLHSNAFHEFHPKAGNFPCNDSQRCSTTSQRYRFKIGKKRKDKTRKGKILTIPFSLTRALVPEKKESVQARNIGLSMFAVESSTSKLDTYWWLYLSPCEKCSTYYFQVGIPCLNIILHLFTLFICWSMFQGYSVVCIFGSCMVSPSDVCSVQGWKERIKGESMVYNMMKY